MAVYDEAISKLRCASGINKGCMLSAEETKALLLSVEEALEAVNGE